MIAFVTGATGYLGKALCEKLLAKGHQVNALYRSKPVLPQQEGLTWVHGDINDRDSLMKGMEHCTHVFHCAALARLWHRDPGHFYRVNVEGTENILEAATFHQVQKLVYTSTAGVLGRSLSLPLTEDDPRLEPFDNDYDFTKFLAEEKILAYANEGKNAVIVNPSRVYGPGMDTTSNAVTRLVKNFVKQPVYFVPGDGQAIGNYAYIDDVVDGHLAAMEKGISGQRYILGGENLSYIDLFNELTRLTGLKRRRVQVPGWVLKNAANGLLIWSKLSRQSPGITPAFSKKLVTSALLNVGKAETQLGYQVTPCSEGLYKTLLHIGFNPSANKVEGNLHKQVLIR